MTVRSLSSGSRDSLSPLSPLNPTRGLISEGVNRNYRKRIDPCRPSLPVVIEDPEQNSPLSLFSAGYESEGRGDSPQRTSVLKDPGEAQSPCLESGRSGSSQRAGYVLAMARAIEEQFAITQEQEKRAKSQELAATRSISLLEARAIVERFKPEQFDREIRLRFLRKSGIFDLLQAVPIGLGRTGPEKDSLRDRVGQMISSQPLQVKLDLAKKYCERDSYFCKNVYPKFVKMSYQDWFQHDRGVFAGTLSGQKIFQHCVRCNKQRFTDQEMQHVNQLESNIKSSDKPSRYWCSDCCGTCQIYFREALSWRDLLVTCLCEGLRESYEKSSLGKRSSSI